MILFLLVTCSYTPILLKNAEKPAVKWLFTQNCFKSTVRERGRPAEVKVHAAGQGEKSSGWNSFDLTRLPVASEPQLNLGRVSTDNPKRICSHWTLLQRDHILKSFNRLMREWAKWVSEPVNGVSEPVNRVSEPVNGVSEQSECSEDKRTTEWLVYNAIFCD